MIFITDTGRISRFSGKWVSALSDPVASVLLSGYCRSVALSVYNSAMLLDPQVGMLLSVAGVDMGGFSISVKKGELLLDANLYGAFFAANQGK